jgi:hypothetical protein
LPAQLKKEGKTDEANAIVKSLSKEDWKTYKELRTKDKTKQTKETKKSLLPIYQKAQKLKAEGKTDEADALVKKLTVAPTLFQALCKVLLILMPLHVH